MTRRHILVVDDSPTTRGFVRDALEAGAVSDPCEVVEAGSGFDALRLLPRDAWDLVITDINMPDINGLELVSFIRRSERHRATPILIISTQSAERDRARGLALGADAWLEKPFSAERLAEAVAGLLGGGARAGAPPAAAGSGEGP